jgi:hypothetical protein
MRTSKRPIRRILAACSAILVVLAALPRPAIADGGAGEVIRGPYTLSAHGGGQDDSSSAGVDGRADFLNPLLSFHLFGMYSRLDDARSIGQVDNKTFGGGVALSHTFAHVANVFAGYAFLNEVGESFAHAYLGGKFKLGARTLVSAAYGFGLGDAKQVASNPAAIAGAESVDWAKAGVEYVGGNGWKADLKYRISDPGGHSVSGAEGGFSYPLTAAMSVGVNGDYDITTRDGIGRNWRGLLFFAYSFGREKAASVDVALDKSDVIIYPVVLRTVGSSAAGALSISPTSPTVLGCSQGSQIFTASGGAPPYTWSSNPALGNFVPNFGGDNTKSFWDDSSDDFCSMGGTVQITVQDSKGATAVATITIP